MTFHELRPADRGGVDWVRLNELPVMPMGTARNYTLLFTSRKMADRSCRLFPDDRFWMRSSQSVTRDLRTPPPLRPDRLSAPGTGESYSRKDLVAWDGAEMLAFALELPLETSADSRCLGAPRHSG